MKMLFTFKCRIEGIPHPQYSNVATIRSNSMKVKLWNASTPNQTAFAEAFGAVVSKAKASFPESTNHPIFVYVKFFFPHQKKHFFQKPLSKQDYLYEHALSYVTKTPDIDKCIRLIQVFCKKHVQK